MAFRPKRQARYQFLRDKGFLAFEARIISKRPSKLPYIKRMIADRAKLANQAFKEGWSKIGYRRTIYLEYDAKGWHFKGKEGRSVWEMMHFYEDMYKAKFPDYKSPPPRRKDFIKDIRTQLAFDTAQG